MNFASGGLYDCILKFVSFFISPGIQTFTSSYEGQAIDLTSVKGSEFLDAVLLLVPKFLSVLMAKHIL